MTLTGTIVVEQKNVHWLWMEPPAGILSGDRSGRRQAIRRFCESRCKAMTTTRHVKSQYLCTFTSTCRLSQLFMRHIKWNYAHPGNIPSLSLVHTVTTTAFLLCRCRCRHEWVQYPYYNDAVAIAVTMWTVWFDCTQPIHDGKKLFKFL